jgi:hypothetical protein
MRHIFFLPLLALAVIGCGGLTGEKKNSLVISPKLATVARDSVTNFTFTFDTTSEGGVIWSTNGGSVTQTGAYRGPKFDGLFEVTITSATDPSVFDKALVAVGTENSGQITPTELSLGVGESFNISSAFVDVTDEATDWLSTSGEVTSTGPTTATFKAPSTAGTSVVVARSRQNPFLFGKRNVNVRSISISVSPDGLAVAPASVQAFAADVDGPKNEEVTWEATGGTITAAGVWTAPASTGVYTIRARSKANTEFVGAATIIVR